MTDLARGYTIDEAARRLTVSRRTLQQMIADGNLRVAKLGRRVVVPEAEILRVLGTVAGRVEGVSSLRVRKIKLYQRATA